MAMLLNHNRPLIMHIDLNSCFATVCQQAFVHLRHKPLVIAAYDTPSGCIVSPSIEAKQLGITVGMRVREARLIDKNIIVRTPDPYMVRDVHQKFKRIFHEYSPKVTPKSIDEAVLDFHGMELCLKRDLVDVAQEIKQRIRNDIGEYISCSVGIGTNRFLAKTAASLKKPDGLETIDYARISAVYGRLSLVDLHGINTRFAARLNAEGIFTPLQFLEASCDTLQYKVFKSIEGIRWYKRLRGYEVDDVDWGRKSFGQDYSLSNHTADPQKIAQILMKLCEKMGRRLRRSGHTASGVHVAVLHKDYTHWHKAYMSTRPLFSTQDLYRHALLIFNAKPEQKVIIKLSVSCYNLTPRETQPQGLFEFDEDDKNERISDALDTVNDRFGEFTIISALMMGMSDTAVDRIAFGGVKELEDLYATHT